MTKYYPAILLLFLLLGSCSKIDDNLYDQNNNKKIARVLDADSKKELQSYSYNSKGLLDSVVFNGGFGTVYRFYYDTENRVTKRVMKESNSATIIYFTEYYYDGGNLSSVKRYDKGSFLISEMHDFVYKNGLIESYTLTQYTLNGDQGDVFYTANFDKKGNVIHSELNLEVNGGKLNFEKLDFTYSNKRAKNPFYGLFISIEFDPAVFSPNYYSHLEATRNSMVTTADFTFKNKAVVERVDKEVTSGSTTTNNSVIYEYLK
ncbi:hypothetical protein GC194_13995 [bacterium]|nr:hypothetical protein [bacterium]